MQTRGGGQYRGIHCRNNEYNVCMQILQSNYKGMVIARHPGWSELRCNSDRKCGLDSLHPSNYTLHKQLYQLFIY